MPSFFRPLSRLWRGRCAKRRPITLALNIVLLLLFPHGTALGIYGLWKVDKQKQSS